MHELLTQRVMAIACGYEDANDAARLASDPVHKLLVGRDPFEGADLASQPTLSRFENAPDRKQLARLAEALADVVIERHRRRLKGRARRITIDLDPTDDPTHGAQQLALFNGHYDTWCYLPLLGFLSFNDEPEQYLFTAVLRSGKAVAWQGARGILRRLLKKLRRAFPGVRIRLRLDGGFAEPRLLDFLDAQPDVEYVVAMAKNAVLKRKAKRAMRQARRLSRRTGKTEHVYAEALYAARTWSHPRRIVIKAEVVRQAGKDPKDNPRFVITNLSQTSGVGLRAGLLPARRSREPHQGTARRTGDRTHQLHELLGQSVSRADDGRRLRADAGTAAAGGAHRLRAGASLDLAGTPAETGRARGALGAPRGRASAHRVSFPPHLSAPGPGAGRARRLTPPCFPKTFRATFTPAPDAR